MYKNSKYPDWFLKLLKTKRGNFKVENVITDLGLHTVCEEARCPNRGECYASGTATFLILGDICTRNCRFCAIKKGKPEKVDENEPERLAEAVKRMNLKYVVITSVTRDDLPLGGADIFRKSIEKIKELDYNIKVEVLTPDFKGNLDAIKEVIDAKPDVFNHNVETVPRLYSEVRPQAKYERSLKFLEDIKKIDPTTVTKSGIMVGLGEKFDEVVEVLKDLKSVGCDIVTIGQYIQPTIKHYPVYEYVKPEVYEEYTKVGKEIGINVIAAPLVRSSYFAHEAYNKIVK